MIAKAKAKEEKGKGKGKGADMAYLEKKFPKGAHTEKFGELAKKLKTH